MTRSGNSPLFSAQPCGYRQTPVQQTPGIPDVSFPGRKPRADEKWANLYFVREGKRGPFKIGITDHSPLSRLHTLQVGNPRPLHLIGWVYVPVSLERMLHADLAPDNLQGEWFSPTPAVRDAIKETIESFGPMPCQECDRQENARLRDARVAPRPHTCGRKVA